MCYFDKVLSKILEQIDLGFSCVLVTVVEKKGDGPCSVGAKMVVFRDSTSVGTVVGGNVEF